MSLCFGLLSFGASAQVLTLGVTNGGVQHKERLLHPRVYRGYALGVAVDYRRQWSDRHTVFARGAVLGVAKAINPPLPNDLSLLNVELAVGYQRHVLGRHLQSGLALSAHYHYALYSLNYGHPFWLTQYALDWCTRVTLPLPSAWAWTVDGSVGLLSVYARPPAVVLRPYKWQYNQARFHRDLQLAGFWRFQSYRFQTHLQKQLSRKLTLGVGYRFHYWRYPQSIAHLSHAASLQFQFRLCP